MPVGWERVIYQQTAFPATAPNCGTEPSCQGLEHVIALLPCHPTSLKGLWPNILTA